MKEKKEIKNFETIRFIFPRNLTINSQQVVK